MEQFNQIEIFGVSLAIRLEILKIIVIILFEQSNVNNSLLIRILLPYSKGQAKLV